MKKLSISTVLTILFLFCTSAIAFTPHSKDINKKIVFLGEVEDGTIYVDTSTIVVGQPPGITKYVGILELKIREGNSTYDVVKSFLKQGQYPVLVFSFNHLNCRTAEFRSIATIIVGYDTAVSDTEKIILYKEASPDPDEQPWIKLPSGHIAERPKEVLCGVEQ